MHLDLPVKNLVSFLMIRNTIGFFFPTPLLILDIFTLDNGPSSSYLFVLAIEALNCLLEMAREGGFLSGFMIWGEEGGGGKHGTCPICCLLMTPLFFVRLHKVKWFI